MSKKAKGMAGSSAVLLLLGLFIPAGPLAGFEKKIRVVADYVQVHLQPAESSAVVEILERGSVLSLLYSGKSKKSWYYACFKSPRTGKTKSVWRAGR